VTHLTTNSSLTVVLGPGGYVFSDYQKLGLPLEVFLNIVQLICLAYNHVWWWTLIGSFGVLFLAVLIDHVVVSRLPLRDFFPAWMCCRKSSAMAGKHPPGDKKNSSQEEETPSADASAQRLPRDDMSDSPNNVSMAMV